MTADVSHIFENARVAARKLNLVDTETIDKILLAVADEAEKEVDYILQENCRDLALMPKTDPKYDRLMLSRERILGITSDMRKVARLPSPLGRILASFDRPNGMRIEKVSVPFGVIGIIYEARPNVTFDVFSLCLKSGNVCILKGGSDAQHSNNAIINIINKVLISYGIDSNTATLLPNDHSFTDKLLTAVGQVDLIIPRGSGRLINYVREHALVPVIETGAGICHTYFDSDGDLEKGRNIVFNAKTRRVSVCNALDCLIIHRERLSDLANLCKPLSEKNVLIYADPKAYGALAGKYPESLLQPATDDSFGTEFLDYKMAIKTVDSFEEALAHIARYSSKHSESIITENESHKQRFAHEVDAAIFSTVTEYDPEAIAILRQRLPYFLKFDHSSELPIKIGYATPETLGLDRIAAVVGAVMQCPDKAVLIVDAGTCVTYDLLTADGTFAGGNIAPGIRLRLRAMHEHTGKLPLIDDAGETPEIGFSTETAMRAGAVLGVAYEIEGYIARLNKVYPDLFVFLTGGDALKLAAKIKSRIFVDENLVLTGLNRILQENAKI